MRPAPDIKVKIKMAKPKPLTAGLEPVPEKQEPMEKYMEAAWIPVDQRDELPELRNRLANITAQLRETTQALVVALRRIQELEDENLHLKRGQLPSAENFTLSTPGNTQPGLPDSLKITP